MSLKSIPNQELCINALNDTRTRFHNLVNSLDIYETKMQSIVTKRTINGVLAHILISTEKSYPMLLKKAKLSKPMPSFFGTRLGHYFLYKYSEYVSTKMNQKDLIIEYDKAHYKLIQLVKEINESEWTLKTTLPKPSNRTLTILEIFTHQIPNHFQVHYDEITKTTQYNKQGKSYSDYLE